MNAIAKIAIVTIVYAQFFANFGHLVPYISGAQCARTNVWQGMGERKQGFHQPITIIKKNTFTF